MKRTIILTLLIILHFSVRLTAQTQVPCNQNRFEDAFLDKIIGKWNVSGQIGEDKIGYDFIATWELEHQFVSLTFADTANPPQYTAKVFIGYDCTSERYVAHWLDNFGGRFSETLGYGTKRADSLEFRFEYPDGPFLNTFIYNRTTDQWHFHAVAQNSKGIWVTFGDMYLQRKR